MRCFNCDFEFEYADQECCPVCSTRINITKYNFISYIGSPNSLAGYQKSYKMLLLKYIFEEIIEKREPLVSIVIPKIKAYYMARKVQGLKADYDVDSRISEIESSSDYDVFAVIKSQPFKVINEKGFLFLNRNNNNKLVFVLNEDITSNMSKNEWIKLLSIIDEKLDLYYKRFDNTTNVVTTTVDQSETCTDETINLDVPILKASELSLRAKNALLRNRLYTLGDVFEFMKNDSLLSLNSMGQKTANEIVTFLNKYKVSSSKPVFLDSISALFSENAFHLFVEYCDNNDIKVLSDLDGFDFDLLLSEPGFGIKKVTTIKDKYISLLETEKHLVVSAGNIAQKVIGPTINIDPSNENLELSYLTYAGVSNKYSTYLFENGFSKIGNLNNISLEQLLKMFSKSIATKLFENIKLFEKPLVNIIEELLLQQKSEKSFDIYVERANQNTLQAVADKYGVTRERARQIEAKFSRSFSPLFLALVEQHMSKNNTFYILTQDVLEFFDDDKLDIAIMYALKSSEMFEYLSFADMFIKKDSPSQDTKKKLYALTQDLFGDEGLDFFESLNLIEEMLNDSGLDFISTDAYLNYLIEINAHFYGNYVFLHKQPYVKLCLILINKYFKDGINLYSEEDIGLLREYFKKEFGTGELPDQDRAISARLSEYLVMCDRGKAKTVENLNYDATVIDSIKKYIDDSELKTLFFSEIFNEFEGILSFTSDITNYNGLHGILAYLYHDEYEFSRDCITKKNSTAVSLTLTDRLILLINEKGHYVTRAEIKRHIGGTSDIMITNAVYGSKLLLPWDYSSFTTTHNLNITDVDKSNMQDLLEEQFDINKGYCSDRLIFDQVQQQYPEFITSNNIENPTNLFYILQNMFDNEYQFSRPHICKKGLFDSLTTKNIVLYFLGETQIIKRSEFIDIAHKLKWSETTADLLFYEIEKDYVRISDDVYILTENFRVCEDELSSIENLVNQYVKRNSYMSMIGFNEFDEFPDIQYEWNSFLLVSIIKCFSLGFKLISPSIRDRRYNKEIIVSEKVTWNKLEDVVYDFLKTKSISTISESELLSMLIIHHLITKVIPKELYDSEKLNYSDGRFNLK